MADLLSSTSHPRRRLRELLDRSRPRLASGIARDTHDARPVPRVEQAFDAVYMGGFAAGVSLLGRPDMGLPGESDMIDSARRIVQTVGLPVIADADTGYGNPPGVMRAVRDYEQAGVAAIHLEDRANPKRCGHLSCKCVIPVDEMVAKLHAAADARTDPDFVLIARTDALAVEGVDAAIERARRYADAGADVLWIEAPGPGRELETIAAELDGHTLLLNWLEGSRTPAIDIDRIRKMKFALVLFPISSVLAMASGLREIRSPERRYR